MIGTENDHPGHPQEAMGVEIHHGLTRRGVAAISVQVVSRLLTRGCANREEEKR